MLNDIDLHKSLESLQTFLSPNHEFTLIQPPRFHINNIPLILVKYNKHITFHQTIRIYNVALHITSLISLSRTIYILSLSDNTIYYLNISDHSKRKLINIPITKENKHLKLLSLSSNTFLLKFLQTIFLYDISFNTLTAILQENKKYIKSIHILKFHHNSILLTYKEGKIIIFYIKS